MKPFKHAVIFFALSKIIPLQLNLFHRKWQQENPNKTIISVTALTRFQGSMISQHYTDNQSYTFNSRKFNLSSNDKTKYERSLNIFRRRQKNTLFLLYAWLQSFSAPPRHKGSNKVEWRLQCFVKELDSRVDKVWHPVCPYITQYHNITILIVTEGSGDYNRKRQPSTK